MPQFRFKETGINDFKEIIGAGCNLVKCCNRHFRKCKMTVRELRQHYAPENSALQCTT